jgi:hypothetical protein
MDQTMKINIHYIIMAQHTFHDLQVTRIDKKHHHYHSQPRNPNSQ